MAATRSKMAAWCIALLFLFTLTTRVGAVAQQVVPPFGRDTVLVWKIQSADNASNFVVRIATFTPNRFIEWENSTTQGTVFIAARALAEARAFVSTRLFEGGTDTRGKNATTLWLSQRTFRELKAAGKAKLAVDSIDTRMTLVGKTFMPVVINRSEVGVPVIRIEDERGSERWFLDSEENPLMVKHAFRHFTQTLVSVTTDKENTLRWIKGKKLEVPDPPY